LVRIYLAGIPETAFVPAEFLFTAGYQYLIGTLHLASARQIAYPAQPRFGNIDPLRIDPVLTAQMLHGRSGRRSLVGTHHAFFSTSGAGQHEEDGR